MTIRTIWKRTSGILPSLIKPSHDLQMRRANRTDWKDELALLEEFRPEGLIWTAPLRIDQIRPSSWRTLANLLNARREERWLALCAGQVVGWLHILLRSGVSHQLRIVVRQEWRPEVERLLLVQALQRLGQPRQGVRLEHPTGEAARLLEQHYFRPVRTLRWMQKNLR